MSEHDVLDLLQNYDAAQQSMIAQMISLHLVVIAAVFYFLNGSGLAMKLAVFALYILGNAMFVALMYNASSQVVGAREHLAALAAAGEVSPITQAVLRNTGQSWSNAAAIITNVSIVVLWIGTTYFLFFWKRPKDA
ncbi:MAG TPA: hypothetical protein VEF55_11685 [Candidatus Binatia bacterium]|nr:hypothetical protein [Candidatus Binatia bacterium]